MHGQMEARTWYLFYWAAQQLFLLVTIAELGFEFSFCMSPFSRSQEVSCGILKPLVQLLCFFLVPKG